MDCDAPRYAATEWCRPLCQEATIDLGWSERVRIRTRGSAPPKIACWEDVSTSGLETFLWRAPSAGLWTIDPAGAEGTGILGVLRASCGPDGPLCDSAGLSKGARFRWVVDAREGEAFLILTDEHWSFSSDNGGGRTCQVNIAPYVEHEAGADCLDIADNDADGLADCLDPDCANTQECTSTQCATVVLPSQVPLERSDDLTFEDHFNRFSYCEGMDAREEVLAWTAPETGRFVFDASQSNFLLSLSVRRGTCIGPEAGPCVWRDPYGTEPVSMTVGVDAVQGDTFYVVVDGIWDSHTFGPTGDQIHYELHIRRAEEETGERCSDGIDNDGNARTDSYDTSCGWVE